MKPILFALSLAAQSDLPPGDSILPELPEVSSWHFAEIDGQSTSLTGDPIRDDRYAIDFYPGGFVGYGGCNRFSGTFTRKDSLVTIKPMGRTQGTCAAPIMAMEARLFEILSRPVQVSRRDKETLVLSSTSGSAQLKLTAEEP